MGDLKKNLRLLSFFAKYYFNYLIVVMLSWRKY